MSETKTNKLKLEHVRVLYSNQAQLLAFMTILRETFVPPRKKDKIEIYDFKHSKQFVGEELTSIMVEQSDAPLCISLDIKKQDGTIDKSLCFDSMEAVNKHKEHPTPSSVVLLATKTLTKAMLN
jgi:hypothetical protein